MTKRLAVLLMAVAVLGLASQVTPDIVLINESPSLPTGLYLLARQETAEVGDIVAVDQSPAARPYLHALGAPADLALLKRVAAAQGEVVCAEAHEIRIAQRAEPRLLHDRRGVALPQWRGCIQLQPGELFLLGDGPSSFDSRYFGPIAAIHVRGVYREFLTW